MLSSLVVLAALSGLPQPVSPSTYIFAGCAHSSQACATATLTVGTDPVFGDQIAVWHIQSTFGSPGGWLFSWFAQDKSGERIGADYLGTLYASGLGSPLLGVTFEDFAFELPDGWAPEQLSVTFGDGRNPAGHGETVALALQQPGGPTTVTPEPASLSLVAGGMAGLAAIRRRRRTPTGTSQ